MPTKPQIVTLTNSSVDVLNAIRNNASINYQNYVPVATPDANSIREIGAVIMDYTALQNEFLSALVNRIGRVLVTSRMYDNPLAMFKRGILDMGETVEEIFINLAKPYQFDPAVAEKEVFKREIPDVRTAFHTMNYQKFYKATVTQDQLRTAFLTWEGIIDLISKIVNAMYTSANYDEFLVMKYMLAKNILNGRLYPVSVGAGATTADVVTSIKGTSNKLTFMSNKFNPANVTTHSLKENQYVLVNSDFDSKMNVDVLATAFNMDKAEFMGHVILVDGFGELDVERLDIIFSDDDTYTHFTSAELEALNEIPVVLVDGDYFMIFDNMINFTENYNGEGLYWNYFYHTWKTFSVSPFANATVFVPNAPVVTSVTLTPDIVNVASNFNGSIPLGVTVDTTGFASKVVNFEITTDISGDTGFNATVSGGGVVTITQTPTANTPDSITVRATSDVDTSKYDECVINFT